MAGRGTVPHVKMEERSVTEGFDKNLTDMRSILIVLCSSDYIIVYNKFLYKS